MPDPDDNLRDNAQAPKRARGDSGEVEQHALHEQIAADRYLASKSATRRRRFPLPLLRIAPGNALGGRAANRDPFRPVDRAP